MPRKFTAFICDSGQTWEGIIFRPGSEGNIQDCYFAGARKALRFFPGPMPGSGASTMLYPGIYRSIFTEIGVYAVELSGTTGYTYVELCTFDDTKDSAMGVYVYDTDATIKDCIFDSHGNNTPQLYIWNADVHVENANFAGSGQPGNVVRIRESSSGTVFSRCKFQLGAPGDYYILAEGCSPLIDNGSFETKDGGLSVIADEENNIPAHPILLNPASILPGNDKAPFDNSTMNATGNSSIALQWYLDVNVEDPDGHITENAPVWVKDRNGDPASPSSKLTDSSGLARWFVVTEFIQYYDSIENFNTFNVSASNNSVMGFADPEPSMNMSKVVTVTIPFSQIPFLMIRRPPRSTPMGVQSGLISIDFILDDPNPGDNGNMSINVEYSTDGISWDGAIAGPESDIEHLNNNTLYHFIWDSADFQNLYNAYYGAVYIRITPMDRVENGSLNQTGSFPVDNESPILLSGPIVDATNITAIINWTVHESANASAWFGLEDSLTDLEIGSIGSSFQSVALTDLQPGRRYTYNISSVDQQGNKFSSPTYTFETKIIIQLYKGWNMISIPPNIPDSTLEDVLSPITGQYDAVQWYDPSDKKDPWKHHYVGKVSTPFDSCNDLDNIETRMGLWIHIVDNTVFIPDQVIPEIDHIEVTPLYKGWNFVGYPSVGTRDVVLALLAVPYDKVMTYDAASGQWLIYDQQTGTGDLTYMEPGQGYWIHTTADFNWSLYYE
jgi:hypothetical protein